MTTKQAMKKIPETVGAIRLREIAMDIWPQACSHQRHLLQMADQFDEMVEEIRDLREQLAKVPEAIGEVQER